MASLELTIASQTPTGTRSTLSDSEEPLLHATLKSLAVFGCLLASGTASAQISDGGIAPSLDRSLNLPLAQPPVEVMPPVDVRRYLSEDALNVNKDVPFRYGAKHSVAIDAATDGIWDQLPDGSWLWRVEIESTDAYSLNLIFDRYVVPPGARMFLHAPTTGDQLGAFTDFNMQADETFATMLTPGDTVIVEYHEPANAAFAGDIRIGTVTHGYKDVLSWDPSKAFGSSGSCNNNVNCAISAGWEDPIRSVVMLMSGGNGFCTGAIVNNTAQDETPYLLTANHCGCSPTNWVVAFNWESATCSNPGSSPPYDSMSGATFRASRSQSDFCLVEMNNSIPLNYNPFYAGWDHSGNVPSSTVGIHHPSGDIKKFSIDNDPAVLGGYFGPGTTHWEVVDWDDGTTEPGSSGSPVVRPEPAHRRPAPRRLGRVRQQPRGLLRRVPRQLGCGLQLQRAPGGLARPVRAPARARSTAMTRTPAPWPWTPGS